MEGIPKLNEYMVLRPAFQGGNRNLELRKLAENEAIKRFIVARAELQPMPPEECWPWPLSRSGDGYGIICLRLPGSRLHYRFFVHRLAYQIAVGKLERGMRLLHTCDNPPCWNPAHLKPGTQAENMQDMAAKGRQWKQR